MSRLVEGVAPARLGTGFRWLLASSWISNLGDGFALSAGPLLVASQTRNPTLVALATLLQQLPWLLFGLFAGTLADRHSRLRIVIGVDLARSVAVVALATTIVTDVVNITLVLVALFLFGTSEVFANTAGGTLLPSLVAHDDLVLANGRHMGGYVTMYQLVGPPMGAALTAVGRSVPFFAQAVLVVIGAAGMSRIRLRIAPPEPGERSVRREVSDAFRWVIGNPPVRTLVGTILTFNVTWGAAWSVLVLWSQQRLHFGAVGFGLLTTAMAVGGLLGTASYGWLTRRVSLGNIMRAGLIIETFTHLALANTTVPWVAIIIMAVFGAHAFIWSTTSVTIRQRSVPDELRGRVGSINAIGTYGGIVLGSAIGGPIASIWGITGPFWFAFGGSALFVVLIWRQLRHLGT